MPGGIYRGNEHEFGEYLTDIDYSKKILDENKIDTIADQLAEYLVEKYRGTEKSYGRQKGVARKKALQVLGEWSPSLTNNRRNVDNVIERRYPPRNLSSKTAVEKKKILIDAVNRGFVEDFNLHEPWHWNVFMDDSQPSTFPFQHDSVITYSQRSRHEFFSEEYCDRLVEEGNPQTVGVPHFDRFFRHQSVFTVGGIKAGNTHSDDVQLSGKGTQIRGVYTHPDPEHRYGLISSTGGVILELQIPTESLIITGTGIGNSGGRGEGKNFESLPALVEHFGSPRQFYQDTNGGLGEWVVEPTLQIEKDVAIPLQWVTGVYDSKFADDHLNFIPLSKYRSLLREAFPERMPGSGSQAESSRDHRELVEVKKVERLIAHPDYRNKGSNDTELFEDRYGGLTRTVKKLDDFSGSRQDVSYVKSGEYIELLEEYDREVNQLREEMESLLEREIEFRNVYDRFIQLEKFEKQNGWRMLLENFFKRNNRRIIYLMNGFYSGKIEQKEAWQVLEKMARDVSGLPVVNLQELGTA